jgi:hypothetical protein
MSELIQCEICDECIDFNEYTQHIQRCMRQNFYMDSLLNYPYEDEDEYDDDDDDDDDDEDNYDYNIDEDDVNILQSTLNIILDSYGGLRRDINDISFNVYEPPYEEQNLYPNLEDVKIPVKDINLVAPIIKNNDVPANINCAICQDEIGKTVRKTLCNHYFCSGCIEPWLKEINKTCPSCLCNLEDLLSEKIAKEKENETENKKEKTQRSQRSQRSQRTRRNQKESKKE